MIRLTRLNEAPVILNSELIETIESTPDTVIRLTNGERLVVRENTEEILASILEYRRSVASGCRVIGEAVSDNQ